MADAQSPEHEADKRLSKVLRVVSVLVMLALAANVGNHATYAVRSKPLQIGGNA